MGNLEIIDTLCRVTSDLADLVNQMTVELEQANVAQEVMEELNERKRKCDEALDVAEYRIRRLIQ